MSHHPFVLSLLSWACLPVYVVQGLRARRGSLRLSPAEGPRSGTVGDGDATVRLLTLGDSSAAAVGIDHTSGSIAPKIAQLMAEDQQSAVSWHISGHNSAVSEQLWRAVVPNLPAQDYTHILIMVGANDMKNWHSVGRFKREFGTLLYAVRARFPEAKIYWSQFIDMERVPMLPRSLARVLNLRRALLNRKGAQLCVERGVVCIPPLPITEANGFCRDGFHANEDGYTAWAQHVFDHLDHTPRSTPAAAPFIDRASNS
ncbi:MAG: SGNH/GDSL hydrolase family protein [Pseudomonadota bacterium]